MALFHATRLQVARKRRGLTKVALASEIDVSIRILTEYEAGRMSPREAVVERLAVALDFPPEFFAGDELEIPSPDAATFRARASLSARDRDRALGGVALAHALMDFILQSLQLPMPEIPDLQGMQAEGAAQYLRTIWNLGERPIGNMVHLLESKGVRVFSMVESSKKLDAFATWRGSVPYVFLNVTKTGERSRFDAAHELGHLVLHRGGKPDGHGMEVEANRFAAAFLMPHSQIISDAGRQVITTKSLMALKKKFGVSITALAHRLWESQLIKDWHYHTLCVQFSQLGYRTTEPEPMPRETSQLFEKVFSMFREDGLTKTDLARALSIRWRDLEDLVFGLVLLPVGGSGRRPTRRAWTPGHALKVI